MLMGIDDILALAKTPEEREEMKKRLITLMEMTDEDIDFSDIPRITDFSKFVRGKPRIDAMIENNRRRREERERKVALSAPKYAGLICFRHRYLHTPRISLTIRCT